MKLCNEHDSEVCYASRDCPACKLKEQLDAAEEENEDLAEEIASLKSEINELKEKL